MDDSLSSNVTHTNSQPAPNHSDNEWATILTTIAGCNIWDCNDVENMSFLLRGEFDQEWDAIHLLENSLENPSNVPTAGVAPNAREQDPYNEMMSSLPPTSEFFQGAHTLGHNLRPLESPSSIYNIGGDVTLTDYDICDCNDENMSFLLAGESNQEWDTIPPLEGPSSNYIGGVATSISSSLNVALQDYQDISDIRVNIQGVANSANQDVALLEAKMNLLEGISLATTDSPTQTSNLDKNSGRSLNRHSARAVSIMRKWFDENLRHPYPSSRELIKLSENTHLFIDQVNTWFSNERQRRSRRKGTERVGLTLKMKIKLPEDSVRVLKAWVDNNSGNSRPTNTEKKILAQKAELKLQQVSDWFGNYRKKQRQPQHEKPEVHEDHELVEMRVAQEPGNIAEFQDQNIGVAIQREQLYQDPKDDLDSSEEEWLLSFMNALLDHSHVEARTVESSRDS